MKRALILLSIFASGCSTLFGGPKEPEITPVERIIGAPSIDEANRLLAIGEFDQAAIRFRTVLAGDKDHKEARFGLAETLRLGGNPTAARTEYLTLAEDPAWRGDALLGLGQTSLMIGDHAGALEAFSSVVDSDPQAWRAWIGLAQLSDLKRDWAAADAAYASAETIADRPAIVYNNHGVSMLARGDAAQASQLFVKALQLEPDMTSAQTNLDLAKASVTLSVADVAAAEPDARARAQKLNNYGYVAMLQGRFADAQQYFQAAIEAHPAFYKVAYENLKTVAALIANEPE